MRSKPALMSLAMVLVTPIAWPAETSYDFGVCTHSKLTMLEANADIVAFGVETWGVVSSSTTKEWEGATQHCVGSVRILGGKQSGKGLCKWLDAAGNTAIGEWEYPASGNNVWTWLAGTGRFKGIGGGGTFKDIFSSAQPAEAGTSQGCRHDWGKYTLP